MRAVGYRQLWRYCRRRMHAGAAATCSAVTATAQLAKRQLTWLRREREYDRALRRHRLIRSIGGSGDAHFCGSGHA